MSLTSYLKIPEFRSKFLEHITFPAFDPREYPIKVKRMTDNPQLMGTALDYAIRFCYEKMYDAYHPNPLIAEGALVARVEMSRDARINIENLLRAAKKGVREATRADSVFAYWCYQLANLDYIFRNQKLPEQLPVIPGKSNIDEMRTLLKLALDTLPKPEQYCILNPTFGSASMLVSGADCDIAQDSMIIDYKCVNKIDLNETLLQLVGYYVLSTIDAIDGMDDAWKMTHLAAYFARHGLFVKYPIEDLISLEGIGELQKFLKELDQLRSYPRGDSGNEIESTYFPSDSLERFIDNGFFNDPEDHDVFGSPL